MTKYIIYVQQSERFSYLNLLTENDFVCDSCAQQKLKHMILNKLSRNI